MDETVFVFIRDNVLESTKEEIETAYEMNNKDSLETILYLMKIPAKIEKPKTEWEERRDICDAHDLEMQKVFKAPKSF